MKRKIICILIISTFLLVSLTTFSTARVPKSKAKTIELTNPFEPSFIHAFVKDYSHNTETNIVRFTVIFGIMGFGDVNSAHGLTLQGMASGNSLEYDLDEDVESFSVRFNNRIVSVYF